MSKSQQPAGGGPGGVGPTTSAESRGQKLSHANACWVSSHAAVLEEHLPAPGKTWKWSDTGLSRGILCDLRNRGLIEQHEDGWRTTRRAWRALERYGSDTSEDDGEKIVGQQDLNRYIAEAGEKR